MNTNELKKETLEEARIRISKEFTNLSFRGGVYHGVLEGVEWAKGQAERRYSEEDMIDFSEWCDTSEYVAMFWRKNRITLDMSGSHNIIVREKRRELLKIWVEQFKKKI